MGWKHDNKELAKMRGLDNLLDREEPTLFQCSIDTTLKRVYRAEYGREVHSMERFHFYEIREDR